jgi:polyisoprenoid-binding protein YceI
VAACWVPLPSDSDSTLAWVIESYSNVQFANEVDREGRFNAYDGSFCTDEGAAKESSLNLTMDMAQIELNDVQTNSKRSLNKWLKGPELLDVEKWTTATFEATSVVRVKDYSVQAQLLNEEFTDFDVKGNLTLLGVTKEVSFPAKETRYIEKDTRTGKEFVSKASLEGAFSFNRHDFGVAEHQAILNKLLGEDIKVNFHIMMKQSSGVADTQAHKTGNP